jgi:hypothetical protein
MTEFNFPKVKLGAIDVTDAEMDRLQNQKAFIQPGTHSLKIIKLENKGPAKNDSTFIGVNVHFEAPNGGTMFKYFMLPTVRLKYSGGNGKKGELMPFQNLCKFFEGLGEEANHKNIADLINKHFAKNTLPGRTVTAVVGFSKNHLAYTDGSYVLCDRDGIPFMTESGDYVAVGADRDTALAAAVIAGFPPDKLQKFPEIVRYIPEERDETATPSDDDFN